MTTPVFSVDVPEIKKSIKSGGIALNSNNRSLNQSYSQDHVALDEPDGNIRGLHKKITLVNPLPEDPKPEGSSTVFYSKTVKEGDTIPSPVFVGSDGFVRLVWALLESDSSVTPNGFLKFPNGLTMAWGAASVGPTGSSGFTVTFPKPFKQIFSLNVTFTKSISASKGIVDVWVTSKSPVSFILKNTDSSTYGFNYLAIGM